MVVLAPFAAPSTCTSLILLIQQFLLIGNCFFRWRGKADYLEAVLGSFAARQLKLKVGDKFHPYHGLNFDEKQQHKELYVVTGILELSNTPAHLRLTAAATSRTSPSPPAVLPP